MFDTAAFADHESVHLFHDKATGLRAIVAIHSTALGPAAGGCRMWNYVDGEEAMRDALRLSEGMSYKNAIADLPLGGGKGVIWGDSKTQKSPELFRAFGQAVDSLNGKYWTAEDVGISPDDMKYVAEQTRFVAGLNDGEAASGDPSPVTALGVFKGIEATAMRALNADSLDGVRVAVQGVGHVGGYVCSYLAKAGAHLTITDINQESLKLISEQTGATIVAPDEIYDIDADVFSPNALGAVINDDTLSRFKVKAIAGGANNQLATADMGEKVRQQGILYAPDFVINGGGIINVASEISGVFSTPWVESKVETLTETLGQILDKSLKENRPSSDIALEIAKQRIEAAKN